MSSLARSNLCWKEGRGVVGRGGGKEERTEWEEEGGKVGQHGSRRSEECNTICTCTCYDVQYTIPMHVHMYKVHVHVQYMYMQTVPVFSLTLQLDVFHISLGMTHTQCHDGSV